MKRSMTSNQQTLNSAPCALCLQVSVRQSYEIMRDALNATGRPILYSLCSWGSGQPHLWGKEVSRHHAAAKYT